MLNLHTVASMLLTLPFLFATVSLCFALDCFFGTVFHFIDSFFSYLFIALSISSIVIFFSLVPYFILGYFSNLQYHLLHFQLLAKVSKVALYHHEHRKQNCMIICV